MKDKVSLNKAIGIITSIVFLFVLFKLIQWIRKD